MRGGKQGRASREERRAEKRGEGILGTEVLRPEASVQLGPVGVQGGVGVITLLWVQGLQELWGLALLRKSTLTLQWPPRPRTISLEFLFPKQREDS